jgi:hypothetical protein
MKTTLTFGIVGVLGVAVLAGCGGGAPSLYPQASAPPSTPPSSPSTTGPAAYAEWVALQGFGGGSGLAGLTRAPRFLREHLADPGFDLDAWADIAAGLVAWLDAHPPAACWTEFHAAMASKLGVINRDFAELRKLAAAGTPLQPDQVDGLEADLAAAQAIPMPSACP